MSTFPFMKWATPDDGLRETAAGVPDQGYSNWIESMICWISTPSLAPAPL